MIAHSNCLRGPKRTKVQINKALNWKIHVFSIFILLMLSGCIHHAKPVVSPNVNQPIHIRLTSETIDTIK